MTVYVDNVYIATAPGQVTARAAKWCHMTADTREELHEFAARIGLRRSWFQDPVTKPKAFTRPGSRSSANWHYDVTMSKRAAAVKAGAVEVTSREMSAVIEARWRRDAPPEMVAAYDRSRAEWNDKYAHPDPQTQVEPASAPPSTDPEPLELAFPDLVALTDRIGHS